MGVDTMLVDVKIEDLYSLDSLIDTNNLHGYCQNCLMEQINKNRDGIPTVCCRGIPKDYELAIPSDKKKLVGKSNIKRISDAINPTEFIKQNFGKESRKTNLSGLPYQDMFWRCTANRKVFNGGRRIGKTTALLLQSLYEAILNGKRVLFVTVNWSSVNEIWEEVLEYFSDDMLTHRKDEQKLLKLKNGGLMKFVSDKRIKYSCHGSTYDVIVLDEMVYMDKDMLCYISGQLDPKSKLYMSSCSSSRPEDKVFHISALNVMDSELVSGFRETFSKQAFDSEICGWSKG